MAAGRAGAAARKTKQEKLLAELREAKAAIRSDVGMVATPPAESVPVVPTERAERRLNHTDLPAADRHKYPTDTADWTPWLIKGLGLAGMAALFRFAAGNTAVRMASSRSSPSVGTGTVAVSSQAKHTSPLQENAKQLKASPDPFYME